MATLTARGATGLIELRFETDPRASDRDWLVLRGRGVVDRRTSGKRAWIFDPTIQLDLTVRARRARTHTGPERPERNRHTDNQHAALSRVSA
jgi:hypothetical protein